MKVYCFIPARYKSTRFPGKPLADILGKPMIQHVYERARKRPVVHEVIVATDDRRIFRAVRDFGGAAVMTPAACRSGTDRVAAAVAKTRGITRDDIIVNIQGDQPLFEPRQIDEVARPLMKDAGVYFSTLVYRIRREEEIFHPHAVKTVFDKDNFALYFSRAAIPFARSRSETPVFYKHHGIYAYRKSFLRQFAKLKTGKLESLESLEQLRALEHGFRVKVVESRYDSVEVDSPDELDRVRNILEAGR